MRDMRVVALVGVPAGLKGKLTGAVNAFNRILSAKGYGPGRNEKHIAMFEMDGKNTENNINAAVKQIRGDPDSVGATIVLFAPQIEEAEGLNLAAGFTDEHKNDDNFIVIADAYKEKLPDLAYKYTLARDFAFGMKSADGESALDDIKDLLAECENYEDYKEAADIKRLLLMFIKMPIKKETIYSDIETLSISTEKVAESA